RGPPSATFSPPLTRAPYPGRAGATRRADPSAQPVGQAEAPEEPLQPAGRGAGVGDEFRGAACVRHQIAKSTEAPARRRGRGVNMGQPVVHFEVVGRDAKALRSYYGELFGWQFDADNPMNYGIVQREQNVSDDGVGIGGGIGAGPEGYEGHVTFYVGVPDVEAALAKAESLGGSRMMGPERVMEQVEIGQFQDPEGHVVGVAKTS